MLMLELVPWAPVNGTLMRWPVWVCDLTGIHMVHCYRHVVDVMNHSLHGCILNGFSLKVSNCTSSCSIGLKGYWVRSHSNISARHMDSPWMQSVLVTTELLLLLRGDSSMMTNSHHHQRQLQQGKPRLGGRWLVRSKAMASMEGVATSTRTSILTRANSSSQRIANEEE